MNYTKDYLSELITCLGKKYGFEFSFVDKSWISSSTYLSLEVVAIERDCSGGNEINEQATLYDIQPRCTLTKTGEVNANYLLAASDEFARAAAFMQELSNSHIKCFQSMHTAE